MAEDEVVFDNTVDALFRRALGSKLGAGTRGRLREAGLDLDAPLRPAYPRLTYYRCVHIVAEDLYRTLPSPEAMFQLGAAFIHGFNETLLGKAVLSVVRMLGPKRTLARMDQNFRSSNNYMKTELVERGPGSFELKLSQVSGVPDYFRGVIQTALTIAGAKNLVVKVVASDGTAATLTVQWTA